MNTKDEALKLTLERINLHLAHHEHGCVYLDDALVAVIRKALAEQPAQQQNQITGEFPKLQDAAFHNGPYGFGTPENAAFVKGAKWVLEVSRDLDLIAQQQEPVATLHDDGYWTPKSTEAGRAFNGRMCHAGSKVDAYTSPPQRKLFDVFAVTVAYEQGVGKGHQAYQRKEEITNPYTPGDCNDAWMLGYKEGQSQARRAIEAARGITGEQK